MSSLIEIIICKRCEKQSASLIDKSEDLSQFKNLCKYCLTPEERSKIDNIIFSRIIKFNK